MLFSPIGNNRNEKINVFLNNKQIVDKILVALRDKKFVIVGPTFPQT